MRADAQVLKGHLDTLLLASLEGGPRHGYAVKEALRSGSGARFDLPTGTLYPALRRLAAAGLVAGTWAEAGGRRRRIYELTPAGRRQRPLRLLPVPRPPLPAGTRPSNAEDPVPAESSGSYRGLDPPVKPDLLE